MFLFFPPVLAINPCETRNGGCAPEAYCKRTTPGSRVCECKADYTGDGIVCLGRGLSLTCPGGGGALGVSGWHGSPRLGGEV